VPSFAVKSGDKISIREGSRGSKLFSDVADKKTETTMASWLTWDETKKEIEVKDGTFTEKADLLFDLGQVIEYYQR